MRLLVDMTPLRSYPAFRRLWVGSTLSSTGTAMTNFAVTLQVYDLTRSTAAVGFLGVAVLVPLLTVGLLGGSIADAIDRRALVLVTSCVQVAVSGALAAQAFAGLGSVWLIYVLVAVQSALSALSQPARRTFIPSLLPAGQLATGMALNRVTFQLMTIVGPALAGVITGAFGLRACYLVDAVSFGGALYGVARLPPMRVPASTERPGLASVAAGLRFIRRSPVLAGAFLADLNATFFALPLSLFPAINASRFGGDPRTLGMFSTAIGVGGLVTALLSGPVKHMSRHGAVMLVAVAVWGAAFAVFAVASPLWLTLVSLGVAGAADTFTVVFRGIIVQRVTPESFRGRVTAADFVVGAGGAQLGSLEAGAVGSLTSPVFSALSGGVLAIAGAVAIGAALPGFRRYRDRPREPNAQ
jgi:MFS family permease